MNLVVTLLCALALFVPAVVGVGVTFVAERFLERWAFALGWFVPMLAFVLLYALYHIFIRALPCEPAGSLACGQPPLAAFLLFLGVFIFTALANASAQLALYFFKYPPGAPAESEQPPTEEAAAPELSDEPPAWKDSGTEPTPSPE